jgi:hypothetical protein
LAQWGQAGPDAPAVRRIMWLLPLFQSPAKCALIAGITGQDDCYLKEWLLGKGCEAQPGECYCWPFRAL